MELNTRVAYSRRFLRDTGQVSGHRPFLRGKVTAQQLNLLQHGVDLVEVTWDAEPGLPGFSTCVNAENLVPEDRLFMEAA